MKGATARRIRNEYEDELENELGIRTEEGKMTRISEFNGEHGLEMPSNTVCWISKVRPASSRRNC